MTADPGARNLEILARKHYGPVYALAARMTGHDADARDIAQETMARALAARESFDPSRPFLPWILSIAANLVRDRFRRSRPVEPLDSADEPAIELAPDTRLIRNEDRDRVLGALDTLPADLRMVAVLVWQGHAHADVAQALGISVNAVRIRLFRALAQLRSALQEKS